MKNSPEEIRKVLSFDGLAEAERVTGRSYKEDESTQGLGLALHLANARRRTETLTALGDSTFSEPLDNYLRIIADEGFQEIYRENIKDPEMPKNELRIFWHRDGILLCFDTYGNGRSVNGGKFYYNWAPNDRECFFSGVTSSGGMVSENVWAGDHDCREAIRFNIATLRQNGKFVNPWHKAPFLWLLSYMDTKDKNYEYKAITRERFAKFPADVRAAIGELQ